VGLAAILSAFGCAPLAGGSDAQLQLMEVGSWVIPDSFPLSGLATSPSGKVVLWSRAANYLIILDEQLQRTQYIDLPGGAQPSFIAFVADSLIEFVTQAPVEIYHLSLTEGIGRNVPIGADGSLISAARADDRWLFLLKRSGGDIVLGTAAGDVVVDLTPERDWGDMAGVESAWVAVYGEEILLTETQRPYMVGVYRDATSQRLTLRPPLALIDSLRGENRQPNLDTWMSLRTLRLDRGYVQTIADVASDHRVLVRYDERGRVTATRVLAVPIGFAASIIEKRTLIAARRINHVEVVKYRWRWSDSSTPNNTGARGWCR
jgi:hypothetical protein